MTFLYTHIKSKSGFSNIHSFIKRVYVGDSPERMELHHAGKIAGFDDDGCYWVLSPVSPLNDRGLFDIRPVFKELAVEGNRVVVDVVAAFDNRGKALPESFRGRGQVGKYKLPRQLESEDDVLAQFKMLTGLKNIPQARKDWKQKPRVAKQRPKIMKTIKIDDPAAPHGKRDINVYINNIYAVHGVFEVEDPDRFLHALTQGIGSRKSYGFGVLFARPYIDVFDGAPAEVNEATLADIDYELLF